jgi:hypothetical protein
LKKKTKLIALIGAGILILIFALYYHYFIYGFRISTGILIDTDVKIKDNTICVTADTMTSGYAFAGYDTVRIVDELLIKPRYCIASNLNRSGKLTVRYDINGFTINKIFLVGITEEDKKQIWPEE